MRFPTKTVVVVAALCTASAFAYAPLKAYWVARNRPEFRTSIVTRGSIVATVESTGTVDPVLKVQIGSFVSGPVVELCVDFNDRVQKDDLLARIDPRIYEAAVARDQASLAHAKAEVARVTALLQQAINDEKRAMALRATNEDYLADTELDRFKYNRISLEAQVRVAEAAIDQAEANLTNSNANLDYTEIRSPVDGIIIDRKIDPGQTLAAQVQTPELFIVAPNMHDSRTNSVAAANIRRMLLSETAQVAPVQIAVMVVGKKRRERMDMCHWLIENDYLPMFPRFTHNEVNPTVPMTRHQLLHEMRPILDREPEWVFILHGYHPAREQATLDYIHPMQNNWEILEA